MTATLAAGVAAALVYAFARCLGAGRVLAVSGALLAALLLSLAHGGAGDRR